MGFFKKSAGGRQPSGVQLAPGIVDALIAYGHAVAEGRYESAPVPSLLSAAAYSEMSPAERKQYEQDWVEALCNAALPHGDWAVYGAQQAILNAWPVPDNLPVYDELMDVALRFQRQQLKVRYFDLSAHERLFWEQRQPGEPW